MNLDCFQFSTIMNNATVNPLIEDLFVDTSFYFITTGWVCIPNEAIVRRLRTELCLSPIHRMPRF